MSTPRTHINTPGTPESTPSSTRSTPRYKFRVSDEENTRGAQLRAAKVQAIRGFDPKELENYTGVVSVPLEDGIRQNIEPVPRACRARCHKKGYHESGRGCVKGFPQRAPDTHIPYCRSKHKFSMNYPDSPPMSPKSLGMDMSPTPPPLGSGARQFGTNITNQQQAQSTVLKAPAQTRQPHPLTEENLRRFNNMSPPGSDMGMTDAGSGDGEVGSRVTTPSRRNANLSPLMSPHFQHIPAVNIR